jgi:hypothetical protein
MLVDRPTKAARDAQRTIEKLQADPSADAKTKLAAS